MVGDNLRMTNLTAALLLSQIEQKDEILNEKKMTLEYYKKYVEETNSTITIQKDTENTTSSFFRVASTNYEHNSNHCHSKKCQRKI